MRRDKIDTRPLCHIRFSIHGVVVFVLPISSRGLAGSLGRVQRHTARLRPPNGTLLWDVSRSPRCGAFRNPLEFLAAQKKNGIRSFIIGKWHSHYPWQGLHWARTDTERNVVYLTSGAAAELLSALIFVPTEVIKCRLQLGENPYRATGGMVASRENYRNIRETVLGMARREVR